MENNQIQLNKQTDNITSQYHIFNASSLQSVKSILDKITINDIKKELIVDVKKIMGK